MNNSESDATLETEWVVFFKWYQIARKRKKSKKQLQWNLFCSVTPFCGHCSFTAKVIKRMVAVLRRFRCTSLSHSLGVNDPFIETHFIIHFFMWWEWTVAFTCIVTILLESLWSVYTGDGRMRPCGRFRFLVLKNRKLNWGFYTYWSSRFLFTHRKKTSIGHAIAIVQSNGRCKWTFSPSFRCVWLVIHICYEREKLVNWREKTRSGRRLDAGKITENFGFIFKECLISHWAIPNLKWWILTTKNE